MLRALTQSLGFATAVSAAAVARRQADPSPDSCPGYTASNVVETSTGLTADLALAGAPCNAYGTDIENLRLTVNHDSGMGDGIIDLIQSLTVGKFNVSMSRLKTLHRSPTRSPKVSSLPRTALRL